MRACQWVVYAKRPFAGPKSVLAYLSRYTHRVEISNQRLVALDERGVTFRWKDYRVNERTRNKTMTLEADEFMPGGFHRIRHCGLIVNPLRRENLAKIRELLDVVPASIGLCVNILATVAVLPTFVCRNCGSPMIIIDILQRSGPIRAPPVQRGGLKPPSEHGRA
jgi:hypothetical protein